MSKQSDILIACRNQFTKLGFDYFRAAAALPSADIGHNTVSAEIVAAVHNGKPRVRPRPAQDRKPFCNLSRRITRDIKHPFLPAQRTEQQLWETPQRVRPKNQINMRITFFDFFGNLLLLHHAAAKRNHCFWTGFFYMGQCTNISQCTGFCMFTHSTGII